MRLLPTLVFLFLLAGHSSVNAANTTLFFSGDFKLILPSTMFANATVLTADPRSISLTVGQGGYLGGQIIDGSTENLPEEFDIREYPKYLFKTGTKGDLKKELADSLSESAKGLDYQYGLDNLSIKKIGHTTIYSVCSSTECLAFAVKDFLKDHIFSVFSSGIKATELQKILEESLHVDEH